MSRNAAGFAKYNYKTKTIKVEYKREPISNEAINDTTIISFKNNGNNIYTEIEIKNHTQRNVANRINYQGLT